MQSSANTRLICAPPWALARLWPVVGPLLLRGMVSADAGSAVADLRAVADSIIDRDNQLWLALQDDPPTVLAVFCTTIQRDGVGELHLYVHTAVGRDALRWGRLMPAALDAFAKAEGCTSIRYDGPKGWTRVLPAMPAGGGEYVRALQ